MKGDSIGKVGVYVRVSTQEQAKEGHSIPTQIKLLEAFCESQGWTNHEVYSDLGLSAKDTNRPGLKRLQKDITRGEVSVLLVYRLDRLTRSVRDLFDILQFLEDNNCAFKSATENYDTTTAMGRMFIGLVGLLAQWERENLGERVAVNMKEKILTKLEASGKQPYGFRIENQKRVVDEEEKEVLLLMIDTFKRKRSMLAVAQELNSRGIPARLGGQWSHQTVRQLLRNPALYGAIEYDGETVENAHDGIITKEEFDTLNRSITKQNTIRTHAPTRGIFSGILICPQCFAVMVKNETNYRCNKCYEQKRGLIRVREAAMYVAFRVYIDEYPLDEPPQPDNTKPKRDYAKELERLEKRRFKYQQMYADEFMSYEEFQKNMKENRSDIERLEMDREQSDDVVDYESTRNMMLTLADNLDKLTREELIEFMALFVKEVHFTRRVVKYDKNNSPREYLYTVTDVVFNRL